MRTSTAILSTGAALVGVGIARLLQEARHQEQRNEIVLAGNQLAWLRHVSTHRETAAMWAPADMEPPSYQEAMSGNWLLCMVSLRKRLGAADDRQLLHYARYLMRSKPCRMYWEKFRVVREDETAVSSDATGRAVNKALALAYEEAAREPAGR
ncbi:DUF6082 family protein [Streptomyces sp. PTY087I2]|uniref:DUF6082 family protein n=1 Tax=Streptomyces sp. PTY087I2 TaxID=1819298 RepID=UPI00080B4DBB|nr:DUF6082 family protein [Streptomyces sp. PTY087I2]